MLCIWWNSQGKNRCASQRYTRWIAFLHLGKKQTSIFTKRSWKSWLVTCKKSGEQITVIPGLLGVLIDLMIIIPTRVPLNESPVYFLILDWLIGVVVLHIWAFLVRGFQRRLSFLPAEQVMNVFLLLSLTVNSDT